MRKRLLSALLAFAMLIMLVPGGVFAADGVEQTVQFTDEISFLKQLGILEQKFDPQKTVTKAEFTKIILSVLQPNADFSVSDTYDPVFIDVGPENLYYTYIKACKDLKIISGDNSNHFYPDNEMTIIDIITILINGLGYTPYAKVYGGYPTGYYQVANETGISKGVSISNSQPVDGSIMAKLIYNALFADLVVISGVVSPDIQVEIDKNANLLLSRHNIQEYDAQVVDNGITSLLPQATENRERVVLRLMKEGTNLTVYAGESGIGAYIGSRLRVFVRSNKDTGRDEVIHFYQRNAGSEVTLDASKIISVTDSYLEYEKEKDSGKYQKYNLVAGGPTVILNGTHLTSYTNETLSFHDGKIRAIDLDGDSRYDVLDCISFNYYDEEKTNGPARNIYVDSIGDFINCRFNPAMSIDVSEDNVDYQIIWNSEYRSLEDLSADMVVSVAKAPELVDGKAFYFLAVNEQTVEGTVESVIGSDNAVVVNGAAYELSTSILSVKPMFLSMLRLGSEISLHLDVTGKVAYTASQGSGKNYAYLIGAELDNSLNDGVRLKLFVPDVGVGEYMLSSKATIDGKKVPTAAAQFEAVAKRPASYKQLAGGPSASEYVSKPIVVKINSAKEVTEIETENPNDASGTTTGGKVLSAYAGLTSIPYSNEEIENESCLKAALRTPRTASYSTRTNCVDGRYFVTGSTRIINVPDIDTFGIAEYANSFGSTTKNFDFKLDLIHSYENELNPENYKVMSSGQFNSDGRYDLQAYDIDPDTGVAGLLVVRGRTDLLMNFDWQTTNPMYAVLKITEAFDPDTETAVKKIYYTKDGVTELNAIMNFDQLPFYYEYLVKGHKPGDTPYNVTIPALKRGDIIRIGVTGGRLTHLERVANLENLSACLPSAWYPSGMTYPYTTEGGKASKTFPFYLSSYPAEIDSSYVIGIGLVKSKSGSSITSYTPRTNLNAVDPLNPNTYMESYVKMGSTPVLRITIEKNGEVTIKKGSADDIKTVKEDGKEKASKILFFHRLLAYNQFVVFNDER